jgi:hypothetical protein
MKQLAAGGQLLPTDLVVKEGMSKWWPASKVKGLFDPPQENCKARNIPALRSEGTRRGVEKDPVAFVTDPPRRQDDENKLPTERGLRERLSQKSKPQGRTPADDRVAFGVGALFLVMLCGLVLLAVLYAALSAKEARKHLTEANALWEAGEKARAVEIYKSVVNADLMVISTADRPTVFQRVIDFEVEQGNTSAAKAWIETALKEEVPLTLKEPKGMEIIAQVRAKREAPTE